MKRILLSFLLLPACTSSEYPILKFQPHLAECAQRIKCHVIEWQLGPAFMAHVGGSHIDCRCVDANAGT